MGQGVGRRHIWPTTAPIISLQSSERPGLDWSDATQRGSSGRHPRRRFRADGTLTLARPSSSNEYWLYLSRFQNRARRGVGAVIQASNLGPRNPGTQEPRNYVAHVQIDPADASVLDLGESQQEDLTLELG